MRIFTSNSNGIFCEAQVLAQQTLNGKPVYTISGNTYVLRYRLGLFGFKWDKIARVLWIPADKVTDEIKQSLAELGITEGSQPAPVPEQTPVPVPVPAAEEVPPAPATTIKVPKPPVLIAQNQQRNQKPDMPPPPADFTNLPVNKLIPIKEQNDPAKARAEAKEISRLNPGKYVTIKNVFGLFVALSPRLHVFAPSDAHHLFKFYYLNGEEKPFSKAQIGQDWAKTPTMAERRSTEVVLGSNKGEVVLGSNKGRFMKIKLSKKNWEEMGKKAGWLKVAQQTPYQQGYIDAATHHLPPKLPDDPEYMKGWQAGISYQWDEYEAANGKVKMPQIKDEPVATHPEEDEEPQWVRFSGGMTPDEVIKERAIKQTPGGYPMTIRNNDEWKSLATAVNQGIDSHLEGFTRSKFDNRTGECLVHPEELHTLLRRLNDGDERAQDLRSSILQTLSIEEV